MNDTIQSLGGGLLPLGGLIRYGFPRNSWW